MGFGKINRNGKSKKQVRKDRHQVLKGVGKELYLVGLTAVKECTGADLFYKAPPKKQPWEKKWGER